MAAPRLAVIGAGGTQAGAMLQALATVLDPRSILAIDRQWAPAVRARLEGLGVTVVAGDIVQDRANLTDRSTGARLVANLAGPAYLVAPAALDYALDLGADYLDITDDADATAALLARDGEARAKGIAALIGMGSAPGMTNILCRLALDTLGGAPDPAISLAWSVDAADLTPASLRHYFHCLATAIPGRTGVPTWDELEPEPVDFGAPVGELTAVTLGHPEPLTLPRFSRAKAVTNKGAIAPNEVSYLMWLLARCTNYGVQEPELFRVWEEYERVAMRRRSRAGSAMRIDVHAGGNGLRYVSSSAMTMERATGIPAAAGVLLMLDGRPLEPGVWAPECLRPRDFFDKLRCVSSGGGGLSVFRLTGGKPAERLRIRDLLA